MKRRCKERRRTGPQSHLRTGGYAVLLLLGLFLLRPHVAPAQSTSSDPIVGVWRTVDDKTGKARGLIRISKATGQYVGTIERGLGEGDSPDARCTRCTDERHDQPLSGMVILEGLHRQDDRAYTGGRILDPDTGSTWRCDIHVSPDGKSLVIRGFIGLRLLGRNQTWWRESGGGASASTALETLGEARR